MGCGRWGVGIFGREEVGKSTATPRASREGREVARRHAKKSKGKARAISREAAKARRKGRAKARRAGQGKARQGKGNKGKGWQRLGVGGAGG